MFDNLRQSSHQFDGAATEMILNNLQFLEFFWEPRVGFELMTC